MDNVRTLLINLSAFSDVIRRYDVLENVIFFFLTCMMFESFIILTMLRHEKRMPKDPSGHARSEFLRESLTFAFSRLARR